MLLAQLLLRAMCQVRRPRLPLVMLPAAAVAAAIGAAAAMGAHPLHAVLTAGAHLLSDNTLTSGGGPPNP